jgi:transcriptional regulator with XRE-family HTH domain
MAKTKEIDKEFLKKLGERLKNLRINAGYQSQEVFSYECRIPRAQYARYEKGSNITIASLQKIIRFHNITFAEFFGTGF